MLRTCPRCTRCWPSNSCGLAGRYTRLEASSDHRSANCERPTSADVFYADERHEQEQQRQWQRRQRKQRRQQQQQHWKLRARGSMAREESARGGGIEGPCQTAAKSEGACTLVIDLINKRQIIPSFEMGISFWASPFPPSSYSYRETYYLTPTFNSKLRTHHRAPPSALLFLCLVAHAHFAPRFEAFELSANRTISHR